MSDTEIINNAKLKEGTTYNHNNRISRRMSFLTWETNFLFRLYTKATYFRKMNETIFI